MKAIHRFLCAMGLTFLVASSASAIVKVSMNRVIYDAGQPYVTLNLRNDEGAPVLLQAWVDDGNKMSPGSGAAQGGGEFIVMPPILNIPSKGAASIRIARVGGAFPPDREFLRWLNLYEVPAYTKGELSEQRKILVATKLQLKVLYRPALLSNPVFNPSDVSFEWQREGAKWKLVCHNRSAYYFSFSRLSVFDGTKSEDVTSSNQGDLAAPPFSARTYEFADGFNSMGFSTAKFSAMFGQRMLGPFEAKIVTDQH